ncbi:MAG: NapC/NirT family cytochrome c [Coriobacteriia bacterium]|nr:NapC/NirT family cytochrome c [Coriobacteriia bacterium]
MPKLSLAGFKDPVRRPRFVLWTAVAVIALATLLIAALGATSSYWFCGGFCHSVQLDSVVAYDGSSHSMVACVSCHLPVNGDPVTFLYHKAHAGIVGAYELATKTYHVPLNPVSHLALDASHMGSEQCTQCHSANRAMTPSRGIIINHEIHEENHIHCTACHNRVAHPEGDLAITMVDPATGETAAKHADFMTMTACFRCHTLTGESPSGAEYAAPGDCKLCHSASFDLKPANHRAEDFYPAGHAKLATMEVDHATGRPAETVVKPVVHGESEESTGTESSNYVPSAGDDHVLHLESVSAINYCSTCHIVERFCVDCHGVEMPHPADFITGHGDAGKQNADTCAMCHANEGQMVEDAGTEFCNGCHHQGADPTKPFIPQHVGLVRDLGAQACFECHTPTYCAECHVRGGQ